MLDENETILHLTTTQPVPTLAEIVKLIDPDGSYPNLAAALVAHKVIKKPTEFTQALRAARRVAAVTAQLGAVPTTPAELIEAVLSTCAFRVDPASATPLTWVCPVRGNRSRFEADVLIHVVLDKNRNLLGSQFQKTDLIGEVEFFTRKMAEAVRRAILDRITKPNVAFDWQGLVQRCFDTSTVQEKIVIAVLQKFIWQVKRRMDCLPVTHHLLPVLYGSQGCGKSRFVEQMLGVLGSLSTRSDFARLTDNRESELFRHYVIFLDEMEKADRAEMDTVKTVITRDTVSFRPMGTNASVSFVQNASFIGTSNKLLQQLINDPTGNRRFFQLDFNSDSGQAEWDYVNALDFTAMWCSVDHKAEDPSKPLFDEMAEIRGKSVNLSTVGQFVAHLVENGGTYKTSDDLRSNATTEEPFDTEPVTKDYVYLAYANYCRAMKIRKPFEQQSFLSELRRLAKQEKSFPFQPHRTSKFNGWIYTGPAYVPTVRRSEFAFVHGTIA